MKHHIRINGEIKEMDFELGSRILDKNGREIFEGDNVLHHKDFIDVIDFRNGACCLEGCPLGHYDNETITVIN